MALLLFPYLPLGGSQSGCHQSLPPLDRASGGNAGSTGLLPTTYEMQVERRSVHTCTQAALRDATADRAPEFRRLFAFELSRPADGALHANRAVFVVLPCLHALTPSLLYAQLSRLVALEYAMEYGVEPTVFVPGQAWWPGSYLLACMALVTVMRTGGSTTRGRGAAGDGNGREMDSIVEAVLTQAARRPERPAVLYQDHLWDQVMTYGELARQVEAFARALVAWGLQPEDRVALFLENSPAFVVAYLGVHLAGGIVVLINAQYREVELRHILSDSGARICVTSPAGGELLQSLALPTLQTLVLVGDPSAASSGRLEQLSFADLVQRGSALSDPPPLQVPIPEAPAVIGYTSGTTGPAKGALLTHRNLVANIRAVTAAWRWDASDRLLLVLPLFHTHGLMVGLHGTLFTGASAVLRRAFVASDVLDLLRHDESITLFFGVPTMYARLMTEADRHPDPSPLVPEQRPRLFVSGSAPLSPQLFADFERRFGRRMLERYGMTETIMNLTNPYEGERRPGTVGSPFPGQEARIVDRLTRQPLPPGEIGEIEVRGPNVFSRYWNQPDATAEAFTADGWFKTGDLGWCSEDGYFTITGRARELIISGGYNVYPREVEDVLATHPGVAEVAVLGLSDPDLGEQVVAVIVPTPGSAPTVDDITAFCRERLASYKKPRRIVLVETLPRNALGKVQKHLLAERLVGSS